MVPTKQRPAGFSFFQCAEVLKLRILYRYLVYKGIGHSARCENVIPLSCVNIWARIVSYASERSQPMLPLLANICS